MKSGAIDFLIETAGFNFGLLCLDGAPVVDNAACTCPMRDGRSPSGTGLFET